jgi:hypothetical protein
MQTSKAISNVLTGWANDADWDTAVAAVEVAAADPDQATALKAQLRLAVGDRLADKYSAPIELARRMFQELQGQDSFTPAQERLRRLVSDPAP